MLEEIHSAVSYYSSFFSKNFPFIQHLLPNFSEFLVLSLTSRYSNHWHISNPSKGSGYRCILNNSNRLDPSIESAAIKSGIKLDKLYKMLKPLFNKQMFVNPGSVELYLSKDEILTLYQRIQPIESHPSTPTLNSIINNENSLISLGSVENKELSSTIIIDSPQSASRPLSPSALIAFDTLSSIISKVVSVA